MLQNNDEDTLMKEKQANEKKDKAKKIVEEIPC